MSMWVPNSERGPKIQSLGGENEIPHIAFLDFLAIFHFCSHGTMGLQEGMGRQNLVTWPPIKILRPLFTLQLLILPTRDSFHAQKS